MRNRIKIGIKGVDALLSGGVPEGSQVVIAGNPGSGKTLLAFEYLYRGAENGEVGVFFSFNEDTDILLQSIKESFPELKRIDDFVNEKKIIIFGYEETKTFMQKGSESTNYAFTGMISQLQSRIEDYHARRIVIDSLSYIKLYPNTLFEYRNLSTSLLVILNRQHVTSLITAELESENASKYQPEFSIYDGLIILDTILNKNGNRTPTFEVRKMRGVNHKHIAVPYRITPSGVDIASAGSDQ